jgi:hypothetical protein
MREKHLYFAMETVDVDDIAANQTTAGAEDLTLNGADISGGEWVSIDGMAHQIAGASTGNISTVTFTIYGYSDLLRNRAITDTITGINNSAVESTKYFAVITRIAASAAVGTNVYFGAVDEGLSQEIPMSSRDLPISVQVDVTGTIDYTLQHTLSDIDDLTRTPVYLANSDMTAKNSTNEDTSYVSPISAIQLKVNSYSTGATINLHIVPSRES